MRLVGRQKQVEHLKETLEFKKIDSGKLKILGIEGPGGVGKSSLMSMAESGIDYRKLKTLRVYIDSSEPITALVEFIDRLTKEIKLDAAKRFSRPDIVLKETEKTLSEARKIISEAQSNASKDINPEDIEKWVNLIFSFGKNVNRISPKSKEYIDGDALGEVLEENRSAIPALQEEVPKWWNALGIFSTKKNLRNALRTNASKVFADALVNDIESILTGYNVKNVAKPLPSKISGCDRFLLIIDDYESISEFSGEFLARYFLPKLKDVRFQSVAVIAGRDDLSATNPSWNQHLQTCLQDPSINVGPLSREEIQEIADSAEVDADVLWGDTDGYPYFIQLWIEAKKRGGESAVSLKKFHDRTTRWMDENQIKWLNICLFIDEINIDSLTKMAASPREAKAIFEWFKTEGSVRDTQTKYFTVRSYVRDRLVDYLRLCDPTMVTRLENKARKFGVLES